MAQKGYTQRNPNPEKALAKYENREDMDLYEFSDLLEAKFSHKLSDKTIKRQLGIIAEQSENLFNIDNYRIPKHSKIVLPYALYSVLLPIIHFDCTSQHKTYDVKRLINHYDKLNDYIFNKMDSGNRECLIMIPALRNFHDSRKLVLENFEEFSQLNSLMLQILPQAGSPMLNHINESIRSLRRRCYIANLTNQRLVDDYFKQPEDVIKILNFIREKDNIEPSDFPGLAQILKCLTSTDIDKILVHYFIYKSIVNKYPEKDRVTPDDIFKLSLVGLNLMSYKEELPVTKDEDARKHYLAIKEKSSKLFDLNDPVEKFLYDQLLVTAKYLLFIKRIDTDKENDKISQRDKALYNDAIKTMPKEDIIGAIELFCTI